MKSYNADDGDDNIRQLIISGAPKIRCYMYMSSALHNYPISEKQSLGFHSCPLPHSAKATSTI
jgi:hypothetical protein